MRAGVSILDPATTWIDVTATLSAGRRDRARTRSCCGATAVGAGAIVGPDTTLIDTSVGEGAVVLRTHAIGAEIGPEATGRSVLVPAAGFEAGRKAKVGGFVETKNAEMGDGREGAAPVVRGGRDDRREGEHRRGRRSFVNYDGVHKHRTTIG